MRNLSPTQRASLDREDLSLAKCWRVMPRNLPIIRVTSHSGQITLATGEVFVPGHSFNETAVRTREGVQPVDKELESVISSDAISELDLYAGRYKHALIQEFWVDVKYPWTGEIAPSWYIIKSDSYDSERWTASVASIMEALNNKSGRVIGRQCTAVYGDSKCQKDLGPVTFHGIVGTVSGNGQFVFTSQLVNIPGGLGDSYFRLGLVTWTSGANEGLQNEVRAYVDASRQFTLMTRAKFLIEIGDNFAVYQGCDHTIAACVARNNILNYQGYPTIPGADRALETT